MTMQMKQAPDTLAATLIELDRMAPPMAPIAMPKQVLTPPEGQVRHILKQIQSRLMPGRESTRRAG